MMKHNMNQPGKSLGVVGLGGLGHMAVKFGKAYGLNVTVISTSESKREDAIRLLGADRFINSKDKDQMAVYNLVLIFSLKENAILFIYLEI
jgi:cinnamyl-alcohol dehydrogenase